MKGYLNNTHFLSEDTYGKDHHLRGRTLRKPDSIEGVKANVQGKEGVPPDPQSLILLESSYELEEPFLTITFNTNDKKSVLHWVLRRGGLE